MKKDLFELIEYLSKSFSYYYKANKIINHLVSNIVAHKCKNESTQTLLEL